MRHGYDLTQNDFVMFVILWLPVNKRRLPDAMTPNNQAKVERLVTLLREKVLM